MPNKRVAAKEAEYPGTAANSQYERVLFLYSQNQEPFARALIPGITRRLDVTIDREMDPALAIKRLQTAHHSKKGYNAILIDDLDTGAKYSNCILELLEVAALAGIPALLYSNNPETRRQATEMRSAYPALKLKVLDDIDCTEERKEKEKKGPEHCLTELIENGLDAILRAV